MYDTAKYGTMPEATPSTARPTEAARSLRQGRAKDSSRPRLFVFSMSVSRNDFTVAGHVPRDPCIRADDRSRPDGDVAEDGRARVHGHVVLFGWRGMPLMSTPSAPLGKDSAPSVTP